MFSSIEVLLFDLDGTLVDSVPDLTTAVNLALQPLGYAPYREDQIRQWVGNGAEVLMGRALVDDIAGHADPRQLAEVMPRFTEAYHANVCVDSQLFAGVYDGLSALVEAGYRLGCVTNKPVAFVPPILENLDIAPYFSAIVGGDSTEKKKPAPDPLWRLAELLGTTIDRCVMVGDSQHDVHAARAAGCPVVCVPYGYNHGNDIRTAGPDAVIGSLAELPTLLT